MPMIFIHYVSWLFPEKTLLLECVIFQHKHYGLFIILYAVEAHCIIYKLVFISSLLVTGIYKTWFLPARSTIAYRYIYLSILWSYPPCFYFLAINLCFFQPILIILCMMLFRNEIQVRLETDYLAKLSSGIITL